MKILVVDDEESIVNLIKLNLKIEGYEVVTSLNGADGIKNFTEHNPDLVILDLMLPDMEGYEVLQKIHEINEDAPVILLTAKEHINNKLLGLQLGADDYMTKPFNSAELLLRIKAIAKRMRRISVKVEESNNVIEKGFLRVLKNERKVFVDGKEVITTYKEFDTLLIMFENVNKVFTREELLDKVWGYDFEGNTRAVDILIQRLRKKLDPHSEAVKTVYGVGYKLEV